MRFRPTVPLVVVALLGTLLAAPPAHGQAQDFKALLQKILDAWGTMDTTKVAPYYSQEPGRLFFDLAPLKYAGWAEYAPGVQKLFFAHFSSVKFTLNPDLQVQQRGNFAWAAATVRADIVPKGGPPQAVDGRWTIVLEKRGKTWIIAHDHFSATVPAPEEAAAATLYKRLGGYDAIAAVVDDFIPRLANDAQLGRFFGGMSADSGKRVRQLIVEQLCAATGGPCVYVGRDMKTAHAGMGITNADWEAAVKHLVATLAKFRVPEREKNEVLAALTGLKPQIVEK